MNPNSPFHLITQDNAPEELMLITENTIGEANKYEYNHEIGLLELDRVQPGPTFYPVTYCDVPHTWNEGDNDPLDAVVYSTYPIVPMTMVKGRVIGVMEMDDGGEQDHKIICVNANDVRYKEVTHIDHLTLGQKEDLKNFMEMYKVASKGYGAVKAGPFKGPEDAHKIIQESLEAYDRKFKN